MAAADKFRVPARIVWRGGKTLHRVELGQSSGRDLESSLHWNELGDSNSVSSVAAPKP
jgi:hypothetical protein